MNTTTLHRSGSWKHWGNEKRNQLKQGFQNTNVGGQLVYENAEFKVWSIHLPKGEKMPFHKHDKRYFWTVLSPGKSRSYHDDGSIIETVYVVGDTKYFESLNPENAFVHNLENIGNTTLIFTTVEFKK